MQRFRKRRSVVLTLRDRELCNVSSPYHLSLNVLSQLIRSDDTYYKNQWSIACAEPIAYASGHVYCDNYASIYTIYGPWGYPKHLCRLRESSAKKKIFDIVTYSSPTRKGLDDCFCGRIPCLCLSRFLLSLSEDNWLCQYHESSGELLKEVYVKRFDSEFRFIHIDWDMYGERVVLTSTLHPNQRKSKARSAKDVVANLAVFKVFPLEFYALLEIKRSVFGASVNNVKVMDQRLVLGLGSQGVHIYNFSELLENGKLEPYKLGQQYHDHGNVGAYPTGIPHNFHYSSAPPLLFNVQCYGQVVRFGGFPYHYVIMSPKDCYRHYVKRVSDHRLITDGTFKSYKLNEGPDVVTFHPDNSNRLFFRDSYDTDCFDIVSNAGDQALKLSFNLSFSESANYKTPCLPRTLSLREFERRFCAENYRKTVFCLVYDSELDLVAILGIHRMDVPTYGFVKLYDNNTGLEIKSIPLSIMLNKVFYELYIDLASIVVIERSKNSYRAFHFGLECYEREMENNYFLSF